MKCDRPFYTTSKANLGLNEIGAKGWTSASIRIDQVVNGLYNPRYHAIGTRDSYFS